MITEIDERKGLVRVYWSDIRKRVAIVEPDFAKIVDELDPDKSFPLYLVYLPYGAYKGDTQSIFLPKNEKEYYRLSDPNIPTEIGINLSYGKDSSPLGMVLEKEFEYFIDLKDEKITIPRAVYLPGHIFSFARNLSKKNNRIYSPNGVLTVTSGARSTFMLPNIGCGTNHSNLQRDFNVQTPTPKSLYEHWNVFKEIVNSGIIKCDWKSCLMYFSEKWVDKLRNDESWQKLKLYIHELTWLNFEYERNRVYYEVAFSMIQKKRNLKPNPYLADTARHLFATALGAAPGYIPTQNNNAIPLNVLQKAFIESYGLKKYIPTIMHPTHFNFEEDKHPIYYSLQNPSTHVFSPKSREVSSTLFELRELQHILKIFAEELAKDNGMCSNTIMSKIARSIQFNFYHNKVDRHRIIKPSTEIFKLDKRFNWIDAKQKKQVALFAADSTFVRGCVSVMTNS